MAAWAILVAVEEGIVTLDQPVGQPGCTLRHLLAHAGGYPFEGEEPIAAPEVTRTYSNSGFSLAARAVEDAAGIAFADYLHEAVFAPLAMTSSVLRGSAAKGVRSNLRRHLPVRRRGDAADAPARIDRRGRATHPLPRARRYGSGSGSLCAVPLGVGVRGSR